MDGPFYKDFQDHYSISEDFLSRDARKLGYDGASPILSKPLPWIYRNGDIRAHAAAFEQLDRILLTFMSFPDFKKLKTAADYEEFVRFKLGIVARIYGKYCTRSIIGTPIEVFTVTR
jgi:hypothetical protein